MFGNLLHRFIFVLILATICSIYPQFTASAKEPEATVEEKYVALRVCVEIAAKHYKLTKSLKPNLATGRAFHTCRDEEMQYVMAFLKEPHILQLRNSLNLSEADAVSLIRNQQIFDMKLEILDVIQNME